MTISLADLAKMSPAEKDKLIVEMAAAREKAQTISCKVSEKGALSIYGLGRFPVTLYKGQFDRLVAALPSIQAFVTSNVDRFASKPVKA